MKENLFLTLYALIWIPLGLSAQDLHKSDTIWVNDDLRIVESEDTTHYGVVMRVDTIENIATVQFYTINSPHLVAIHRLVATGEGARLRKGKQLYYYEDGKVKSMAIYTLVNDERIVKVFSRLAAETLLYPDGKTQEELTITYLNGKEKEPKTYDRKCYYPDGVLQYEEHFDGKETKTVYYKPDGKVTKMPKKKIEPYERMPSFPGGMEELFEYLSTSVKYPPIAQKNNIEGRVIVQFVVAKDGKIEDITVVRTGGDPSLDKEAVRVIKSMPKWKPGTQRGKPVRVEYTVPINFRLK